MFEPEKPRVNRRRMLLHHEQALLAELGARELFDHPTAKGDIGEGPWHRVLRKFLPERYQVSKAFVLDARGDCSDQIDLVIHDRHFCPLLFEEDDQRYIPAESVFAVFEVKPALDKTVVEYAKAKAQSVRRLHRTSRPLVDRGVARPPRDLFPIIAGVLAVESDWSPPFGQPLRRALADPDPADILRGKMDASEFKEYIFGMLRSDTTKDGMSSTISAAMFSPETTTDGDGGDSAPTTEIIWEKLEINRQVDLGLARYSSRRTAPRFRGLTETSAW